MNDAIPRPLLAATNALHQSAGGRGMLIINDCKRHGPRPAAVNCGLMAINCFQHQTHGSAYVVSSHTGFTGVRQSELTRIFMRIVSVRANRGAFADFKDRRLRLPLKKNPVWNNDHGKPKSQGTFVPYSRQQIEQLLKNNSAQFREKLDRSAVDDLKTAIEEKQDVPAPVVFKHTKGTEWLADGGHRCEAFLKTELQTLLIEVRNGDFFQALLYALEVNMPRIGVRVTNADKRKAVDMLLKQPKGMKLTDVAIAKHCGPTSAFVGKRRKELAKTHPEIAKTLSTRKKRDGKQELVSVDAGTGKGGASKAPVISDDVLPGKSKKVAGESVDATMEGEKLAEPTEGSALSKLMVAQVESEDEAAVSVKPFNLKAASLEEGTKLELVYGKIKVGEKTEVLSISFKPESTFLIELIKRNLNDAVVKVEATPLASAAWKAAPGYVEMDVDAVELDPS